jgi:CheY-like chemotaxis protein
MLVDDHRPLLDAVSMVLADDFDVVGVATDGREALDVVRHADPDVMVLDVDMPGLDGFQTLRALAQDGWTRPVVFLSMHDRDEIIGEAFRRGGRGYLLKPHVDRDLVTALHQALRGGMFVPSLTSMFDMASGGGHGMQLYAGVESFADGLADFFDRALRRGDATCVIATERVREELGARLRTRGWTVGGPTGHERLLVIDAADALRRCMRDGMPDAGIVAQIANELEAYRLAVTNDPASRLTIFGNMVVALIEDGNSAAAIELERLWNTFTRDRPFFTLCGYAASCFHDGAPDLWARACTEHSTLSHARGV